MSFWLHSACVYVCVRDHTIYVQTNIDRGTKASKADAYVAERFIELKPLDGAEVFAAQADAPENGAPGVAAFGSKAAGSGPDHPASLQRPFANGPLENLKTSELGFVDPGIDMRAMAVPRQNPVRAKKQIDYVIASANISIATIVLIVWKKGVCFDASHLKPQTAEQVLLKQVGCEARKNPADGVVFFLDFSL